MWCSNEYLDLRGHVEVTQWGGLGPHLGKYRGSEKSWKMWHGVFT